MNLLKETLRDIAEKGNTIDDIVFIGSKDGRYGCSWQEFEVLADFDYNNGFGAAHVASDLIIVFKDASTMWRYEYDGCEWWNYSNPFELPKSFKSIKNLGGNKHMWDSLQDIHEV